MYIYTHVSTSLPLHPNPAPCCKEIHHNKGGAGLQQLLLELRIAGHRFHSALSHLTSLGEGKSHRRREGGVAVVRRRAERAAALSSLIYIRSRLHVRQETETLLLRYHTLYFNIALLVYK